MIYLDNNATTRVLDDVADAMRPYLTEHFANPASAIGTFAGLARAVASAKTTIVKILGADGADQLVITSGATESNNLARNSGCRPFKSAPPSPDYFGR